MMCSVQPTHNTTRSFVTTDNNKRLAIESPPLSTPSKPTKRSRCQFSPLFPLAPAPQQVCNDAVASVFVDSHDGTPSIVYEDNKDAISDAPLFPLGAPGPQVCDTAVASVFVDSHDGVPSIVSENNKDAISDSDGIDGIDGIDPFLLGALLGDSHDAEDNDFDKFVENDLVCHMSNEPNKSDNVLADIYMGDVLICNDTAGRAGVDEVQVKPLQEDISTRISLGNFLTHFITKTCNLQECENPSCNLYCYADDLHCKKCKECGYGLVLNRPPSTPDIEPTDDNVTGVSEDDAKVVMESNAYKQLIKTPSKSPRKGLTAHSNSTAVRNQLGNGISPLGSTKMLLSWQRSFQLHLIPPFVFVLMSAFGYEKNLHQPLRELICSMILSEQLPSGSSFFFTRLLKLTDIVKENEWDIDMKEVHKHVSVIIWATLFLLDLLAYGESYSMLDMLANIFILDAERLGRDDKELAFLFASLGYATEYNLRLLVDHFKNHSVTKRNGKVVHKIGRCTTPVGKIRRLLLGPLFKSLIESMGLVGLFPEPPVDTSTLLSQSNPRLKPFFVACFGGGDTRTRVVSYLEAMLGNCAPSDDVSDVVIDDSKERVRVLPFFLLAYSCHLNNTVLKSNVGAFSVSLLGKGGSRGDYDSMPEFVSRSDGSTIDHASFDNFSFSETTAYETNLPKLLLCAFKSCYSGMLGLDALFVSLGAQKLRPFSFDFSRAGNDCRALESLILKVTSRPMEYINHDGFKQVVKKLQEYLAELIYASGDGAIVTSETTACLVAESLFSEDEYQMLSVLSRIEDGSA